MLLQNLHGLRRWIHSLHRVLTPALRRRPHHRHTPRHAVDVRIREWAPFRPPRLNCSTRKPERRRVGRGVLHAEGFIPWIWTAAVQEEHQYKAYGQDSEGIHCHQHFCDWLPSSATLMLGSADARVPRNISNLRVGNQLTLVLLYKAHVS